MDVDILIPGDNDEQDDDFDNGYAIQNKSDDAAEQVIGIGADNVAGMIYNTY